MHDLTQEDLSALIGTVYDSAFEDPQWTSLLQAVHRHFPKSGAALLAHENDHLLPSFAMAMPGQDPFEDAVDLDFPPRRGSPDGAGIAQLKAPPGYVSRSWKYFSDEDWENSKFYRNVLQPNGYRHTLNLVIDSVGDRGAFLGFGLPDDPAEADKIAEPMFSLLKILSPHIVRASRMARAMALAQRALTAMGGLLDGIILPMLVTDGTGRFLFANSAGRRVIDAGRPVALRSDVLELPYPEDTRALLDNIALAATGGQASGLKVDGEDGPLLFCMVPFRTTSGAASKVDRYLLDDRPLVAMFIGQSSTDAVSPQLLQDVFSLTPREAEVCQALIAGQTASEIAQNADRALKTVRNQIQVIHEKVGVTSNVALIDALAVFRTVGSIFDADTDCPLSHLQRPSRS